MVRPASSSRRASAAMRAAEVVGLAVTAFVPFLLSTPGRLSADTKVYLYLDPARLLSRAPYLWDPHVGAGGVPHQQVGYLWPMGPWFWLFETLGLPDWIAQRLWWGTISLAAGLGTRWLLGQLGVARAGALAGAFVYLLTPYQLAFTARMSVLLLPWAGLPWLVGLALRAVRRGGWRDPARFALVVLTVGGVNASSLLLVGVAPLLVVALHLGAARFRRGALSAAGRMGLLSVGVSLWWIAALRLQGAYGLPVLDLTENLRTIAGDSDPLDLLRGLGNWFFYGEEPGGFTVEQAQGYVTGQLTRFASYGLPAAALAAAVVVRWRHRTAVVGLLVVGLVVGVGAWPYEGPSPWGRAWRALGEGSAVVLALRNTPRVLPVVVLAMAALFGAAVTAVRRPMPRTAAAGAVVVLAAGALAPVWRTGFLSDRVSVPEEVPAYWQEAAAALDAGDHGTRILEVPGSPFAAYRWGNAVDPITPGLVDRPFVAREVLPAGTPPSADLLDAFDRRIQQGVLEAASVAPIARLLRTGTVVLRHDLDHERYGGADPSTVRPALDELGPPQEHGPIARYDVPDPQPIVRTAGTAGAVVVAGDGDGLVDAAAAGLVDGRALLRSLPAMTDEEVDEAIDAGASFVVTDTYRKRPQHWFSSVRFTRGATERAGQRLPDRDGYDVRLDPFGRSATDEDARTLVEHVGGTVDATADGGVPRPEDRAARAYDGDVRTSWRVGGARPGGARLTLETARPVTADRVTLVQPQDGPRDRVLTSATLRFDDGPAVEVELGPASLEATGQVVELGTARTLRRLVVELGATTTPPFDPALANAVGFAEVRVGGVEVDEVVGLPRALSRRLGAKAATSSVDVVLSRLRADPAQPSHQDEELALDRRFALGGPVRTYGLGGTARLSPNGDGAALDALLGTSAGGATFSASGHLAGSVEARASSAFDADPSTAWIAPAGPPEGHWVEVRLPAPVTVDALTLGALADGRHVAPTRVRLEAADGTVRFVDLPPGPEVTVPLPPLTSDRFRLVVEEVDPAGVGPVALTTVGLPGVPAATTPPSVPTSCHTDLLQLDGRAVPIRLDGATADAGRGLRLTTCDGSGLEIDGEEHRLTAAKGLDTGIDLDRLVLSSDRDGRPSGIATRGDAGRPPAAEVERPSPTEVDVTVDATDGQPFWLVLGESHSDGWRISADGGGADVGDVRLVDGYANGWLVDPAGEGPLRLTLTWAPQRTVWLGMGASALAVVACLGLAALAPAGRRRPDDDEAEGLAAAPTLALPTGQARPAAGVARAVGLAAAFLLVADPVAALLAAATALVPGTLRRLLVPVPAVLVCGGALVAQPRAAWWALAVVTALVFTDRGGRPPRPAGPPAPAPAPSPPPPSA